MQIEVDPKGQQPPSEQIADQVRFAVASGRLVPAERLASVRGLASQALVNPNTVARAYRELEREGTVETRPGSGVYVAAGAPARCRKATRRAVARRLRRVLDEALAAGLGPDEIEEMVSRALHAAAGEIAR